MKWRARRWLWLLALLPLAAGLARLRFDVDVLNLLPGDVPAVRALKIQQQHFATAPELILTLRAADAESAEAAARTLAEKLRQSPGVVRQAMWQPPWLERPVQAAELLAYLWFNQPPEVFGALTNRLAATNLPATLADTRQRLATTFSPGDLARLPHDPFDLMQVPVADPGAASSFEQGQELFASEDGTFRLIFVQPQTDLANYRQTTAWLAAVQTLVQDWRAAEASRGAVAIGYTGGPAFTAEVAAGMERDMTSSLLFTVVIIAALFWTAHRRWRPLLWILCLLAGILAGALALGGLFIGTLNVVSTGFAAILLGLAVDYGLVLYQESRVAPGRSAAELRRELAPSIVWAAATTAGAFLVLNFSGLPGLGQLGTLVALGIGLAAVVMLYAYLPPLLKTAGTTPAAGGSAATLPRGGGAGEADAMVRRIPWVATVLVVGAVAFALARGLPELDKSAAALRPRHSEAFAAVDEIRREVGRGRDPHWVLVPGRNEQEVAERLRAVEPLLERARAAGEIDRFQLPLPLWPEPAHQAANRGAARSVVAQRPALRQAAAQHGFAPEALVMTEAMLDTWERAAATEGVFWPTNPLSHWTLSKVVARTPDGFYASGFVQPARSGDNGPGAAPEALTRELLAQGVLLGSWESLGPALLEVVRRDLWRVALPMVALVAIALGVAFRRWQEVALSTVALALSIAALLAIMNAAGWTWNLMNLMALPLLLGVGVDYSIHMQMALRRCGGDVAAARRGTGRALWLCGGTTVAGFGSCVWSSNGGLASLGQVCATGIACAMVVSIYLLPAWWRALIGGRISNLESQIPDSTTPEPGASGSASGPSSLYRANLWRLGLFAGRRLPAGVTRPLLRLLAIGYWLLASARRRVVADNLLPVLGGDRAAAARASRAVFQQFAVKLADLWRFESGQAVGECFTTFTGWDHFTAAQATGRGVLLLTPHLGNWEFGGPLLTARGVRLHVITLVEPGAGFTELRQAARARWGIETLVIGDNPFAFVEIIKRLEAGATVALLMDRPPAASAATVELFGRPFPASVAAAELARAAGCVLLPVLLPREASGYAAHVLPAIPYDRAALGKREARVALTQEIMRAFEPAIRQYLTQWYHFVPVWQEAR